MEDAARDRDAYRRVTTRAPEPVSGEDLDDAGLELAFEVVGQRDPEAVGGVPQSIEVLLELDRGAARRPKGFEDAVAEQEASVEDRQVRTVAIDGAAV